MICSKTKKTMKIQARELDEARTSLSEKKKKKHIVNWLFKSHQPPVMKNSIVYTIKLENNTALLNVYQDSKMQQTKAISKTIINSNRNENYNLFPVKLLWRSLSKQTVTHIIRPTSCKHPLTLTDQMAFYIPFKRKQRLKTLLNISKSEICIVWVLKTWFAEFYHAKIMCWCLYYS